MVSLIPLKSERAVTRTKTTSFLKRCDNRFVFQERCGTRNTLINFRLLISFASVKDRELGDPKKIKNVTK